MVLLEVEGSIILGTDVENCAKYLELPSDNQPYRAVVVRLHPTHEMYGRLMEASNDELSILFNDLYSGLSL